MSETSGTDKIGERDARDAEREDPSVAGKPEVPAFGDEAAPATGDEAAPATGEDQTDRLEEREQRQHAPQQHGDTFAVESDHPADTSGVSHGAANRVTALPGDESDGDTDN